LNFVPSLSLYVISKCIPHGPLPKVNKFKIYLNSISKIFISYRNTIKRDDISYNYIFSPVLTKKHWLIVTQKLREGVTVLQRRMEICAKSGNANYWEGAGS